MRHPWFLVVGLASAQRWSNTTLAQDGATLSTSTFSSKQSNTPVGTAPLGTAPSLSSAAKSPTSVSATADVGTITLSSTLSESSSSSSSSGMTAGVGTGSMTASSSTGQPFISMTDASESASSTGSATAALTSTENSLPGIPGLLPSSTTTSSATLSFPVPLTATPPVPVQTDTDAKKIELKHVLDDSIPQLKHWVEGIQLDPKPVIDGLTSIKNMAEGMLGGTKGGGGGCSSGLFAALRCVIHGATEAVNGATQGITDGLKGTLDSITNLSEIIPKLKPESESEIDNPDKPSSQEPTSQDSTQSTAKSTSQESSSSRSTSSSSSSKCTQSATVTNDHVTCSPTVVGSTITSTTCKTSTYIVSGCSITGTTTTTTVPLCSQTSTATAADVTCSPTVTSFAGQTGTTSWSCTTSTSVFSGCSVTGTTKTTSVAPSSTSRICAFTGCKRCVPGLPPSSAFVPVEKHGLIKRVMEVPGQYASYAKFILAQISGRGRALCAILAHRSPPPGLTLAQARQEVPTSSHSIPFRSTPFSTAVVGLYGCTVVVVVSEAGVFLSHIFEDPTFINAEKATKEFEYGMVSDDAVWERDVTQNLFQGDNTGWTTTGGIMRLIGPGNIFQSGTFNTQVFIITPTPAGVVIDGSKPDDQYRHQKRVGDLQAIIRRRMGLSASIVTYVPLADDIESDVEMYKSARGKVLVQYDPEVRMDSRQVYDPETGNYKVYYYPVAGWKLWVDEKELVAEYYWHAGPDQQGERVPVRPLKIRDEGVHGTPSGAMAKSCVLVSSTSSSVFTTTTRFSSESKSSGTVSSTSTQSVQSTSVTTTSTRSVQSTSVTATSTSSTATQSISTSTRKSQQSSTTTSSVASTTSSSKIPSSSKISSTTTHTTTPVSTHPATTTTRTTTVVSTHPATTSCSYTILPPETWTLLNSVTTLPGGGVCTCNNGQMVGLSTITKANGNVEYLCAPGGGSGPVRTPPPTPKTTAAPKTTEQKSPTAKTTGCLVDSKGNAVCEQSREQAPLTYPLYLTTIRNLFYGGGCGKLGKGLGGGFGAGAGWTLLLPFLVKILINEDHDGSGVASLAMRLVLMSCGDGVGAAAAKVTSRADMRIGRRIVVDR